MIFATLFVGVCPSSGAGIIQVLSVQVLSVQGNYHFFAWNSMWLEPPVSLQIRVPIRSESMISIQPTYCAVSPQSYFTWALYMFTTRNIFCRIEVYQDKNCLILKTTSQVWIISSCVYVWCYCSDVRSDDARSHGIGVGQHSVVLW